jgi:F0F1-type ATP synthase assembly protein I
MITSQGFGLMAELIAAALLIAALIGFTVQGSKPWLLGIGMAIVILIAAVTIVIDSST